ncbi:MAG: hypothetical protein IM669_07550 [Phenylobacterium sp.]|jgi:hypothetical protein|uniref:hypothetical protein n=1 Tax=Phenylobacterium sp. TaxID=1871053 RepID=UPI0025D09E92|nr:hypothetical protein [Phenylobacterium sp.]MCA3757363.1 hypothetical protein [Phenylobacterium sp.]
MERKLDEVVAALPEARRRRIEARAHDLVAEVEGLGELRRASGKAQFKIAQRGSPATVTSDNGTEMTRRAMLEWANRTGLE